MTNSLKERAEAGELNVMEDVSIWVHQAGLVISPVNSCGIASPGSHEHHLELDGGLCVCQGVCEGMQETAIVIGAFAIGVSSFLKCIFTTMRGD